jgi:hypothetical protein
MNHMDGLYGADRQNGRKVEQEILEAIKSIHYGSVEVIIHDSKVVQIERKEKVRFGKAASEKGEVETTRDR